MGHPAVICATQPLEGVRLEVSGPSALTSPALGHLRALGATVPETPPAHGGPARFAAAGKGPGKVTAHTAWADALPATAAVDESTVQAATGMMHVHGRRDGRPRGLAVDYAATCASVLTVQGLLAAMLGRARGGVRSTHVTTGADRAALLTLSQYIAAANAPEAETVAPAPGGPPFTARCGTRFELEALDPVPWARFWRELGAPEAAIRAGWPPFQFRYATACAPLPEALHRTARDTSWARIRQAAAAAGAEVCPLRPLADRVAECGGAAPWTLTPRAEAWAAPGSAPAPDPALPLSGLTVLEAGRRIQAPLAAHLLGLLGADVVRIEPPAGTRCAACRPAAPTSRRAGSP